MTDSKHSAWDIFTRVLTIPAVIIGGGWALLQFYSSADREIHKPIWDRRLDLYEKATRTVATIAASNSVEDRKKALDEFWVLYFGPLLLVEDQRVEAKMVAIGNCLNNKDCSISKPKLQALALELGGACKESVSQSSRDSTTALLQNYTDRLGKLRKMNRQDDVPLDK